MRNQKFANQRCETEIQILFQYIVYTTLAHCLMKMFFDIRAFLVSRIETI